MGDDPLRRLERERDLYKGLLRLNARTELPHFLEEALRLVVSVVDAEQGHLELFETQDSTDEQTWWTAAGCSDEDVGEIRALVSRGISAEPLGTGEVLVTRPALLDPRF